MKKLTKIYLTFCLLLISNAVTAQTTQSTGQQIAQRIASKMRDTLQLRPGQTDSIYQVNMQLHARKMQARNQFTQADSLRVQVQRIENTRDGLYRVILGSEAKYNLYKSKKGKLVSAN